MSAKHHQVVWRRTAIAAAIMGVCVSAADAASALEIEAQARVMKPYDGSPIAATSESRSTTKPDVCGTLSVENFQGTQPNLSNTHESANGWREYLEKFHSCNYVYRDSGVGTWQFHDIAGGDNWDLWTSGTVDYGIDAVLAAFHSSHGGMSATGVYSTSMGQNWAGRGWNASSNKMALGANAGTFGNERLRYMFWDTCQALREQGGKDMAELWRPYARGIRMIFGYRDNSVDSSKYGEYFWEEWNKNKTLTQAFLDASWRISHGQSPAVLAFGSTQSEAVSRRDNERSLYWGAVQSTWGAWSWYSARSARTSRAELEAGGMPFEVRAQALKSRANDNANVIDLASRLGIRIDDEQAIQRRPQGLAAVEAGRATLIVESDGDFDLTLELPKDRRETARKAMDDADYEAQARAVIEQLDLAGGEPYDMVEIRDTMTQASSESGAKTEPKAVETTVVFSQVADDLKFIDPDAGQLEITFDNGAQEVVRVRSAWRELDPVQGTSTKASSPRSLDTLRVMAMRQFQEPPQPGSDNTRAAVQLEVVQDSEEIGYYDIGGEAVPVYRVLLTDPSYPDSKYREAIVPLTEG